MCRPLVMTKHRKRHSTVISTHFPTVPVTSERSSTPATENRYDTLPETDDNPFVQLNGVVYTSLRIPLNLGRIRERRFQTRSAYRGGKSEDESRSIFPTKMKR